MENEAQFTAAMQVRGHSFSAKVVTTHLFCLSSFFFHLFSFLPVTLLQAFGQSFLQPDIHIFKQNLSYLESLNSKHKLYHRVSRT